MCLYTADTDLSNSLRDCLELDMGCDVAPELGDGLQSRPRRSLVSILSFFICDDLAHTSVRSAYAAGATVQIVLFSMNAAKVKLNAPRAQTFLEIIRARWGKTAHIIFTCYAFITSLLVSSMLVTVRSSRGGRPIPKSQELTTRLALQGGAATVTDLTGANQYAISALISLPVAAYVTIGVMLSYLSPPRCADANFPPSRRHPLLFPRRLHPYFCAIRHHSHFPIHGLRYVRHDRLARQNVRPSCPSREGLSGRRQQRGVVPDLLVPDRYDIHGESSSKLPEVV